jgi:predicted dinucleotide-binding enzyme
MKVGILGSGMVGQALGAGFAGHGHAVMLGTRDPSQEKVQEWVTKTGKGVSAGTFAETAAFGEVVLVCTLWSGTQSALELAGAKTLAGKVVVDVTNPLDFSKGSPALALGHTDSGGEQVQRWLPDSKVVKAFNIVTAGTMVSPKREEGVPDMLIAGNDAGAKAKVREILTEFGWPTIDLGGLEASRLLEPLAMIWISYALQNKTFSHAWKLLRK